MNVRAFSDLADIIAAPPGESSEDGKVEGDLESYGSDEDYEDEFEDDFEQNEEQEENRDNEYDDPSPSEKSGLNFANESVLVKSLNSFDFSRSDDSGNYFKEEALSNDNSMSSSSAKSDKIVFLDGDDNEVSGEVIVESETAIDVGKVQAANFRNLEVVADAIVISKQDDAQNAGQYLYNASLVAALPNDENNHPSVQKHFNASTSKREKKRHVHEVPLDKTESIPVNVPKSNVHGSNYSADRNFSRVKKVSAWEVPGVQNNNARNLVQNTEKGNPNIVRETDRNEDQDRMKKEEIVMTVLDMLQSAAKKSQMKSEVEYITASGSPRVVNNFKMGVTKRMAMQASGKFFMERVPDFDPDFDAALQFSGRTSEDRAAGDKNGIDCLRELKPSDAVNPHSSTNTERGGVFEYKKSVPNDGDYIKQQQGSPKHSGSVGTSAASSPGVFSSNTSTPHGRHRMQSDTIQQQYQASPSEQWPEQVYAKRENVLAGLSPDESSSISTACESLYSSFLGDLINCCKGRANECRNTEEMAMLKVLSEHVSSAFAGGSKQEALQCRMMEGAIEVHNATKRRLQHVVRNNT